MRVSQHNTLFILFVLSYVWQWHVESSGSDTYMPDFFIPQLIHQTLFVIITTCVILDLTDNQVN